MRYSFGGDLQSWAYTVSGGNIQPAGNVTVTFWNAETSGTRYTDLSSTSDGSAAITEVTTSNGTDGRAPGSYPRFYGPDGVAAMWAQAGSNPRQLIVTNDAPLLLTGAQTVVGAKTFDTGDPSTTRIVVKAVNSQVADLFTAYSAADTGQGGAAQRTFYLNEKGEPRVIPAKSNSVGMRIKGQTGQTAHVLEQTDISNNPISWMDPDGSWRAPNLGHIMAFSIPGTLTVATGKHRIYNDTGVTLTIRAIRASVGTAPTGAAIRVDVNKNGTTLFTTQGNRPNIAASTNTSKVTNMDVTSLADGDYLTCDVDVIGSTVAGADLTVQVLAY